MRDNSGKEGRGWHLGKWMELLNFSKEVWYGVLREGGEAQHDGAKKECIWFNVTVS